MYLTSFLESSGDAQNLAGLAARLGWYDQSQFARDFTRLVGMPPAAYRDRGRVPGSGADETR